ncbi:hypothetical protein CDD83_10848 [Cordyceps sp. RAO-2017]|nr:hypothetical protein CDD83_10848 [Cordyceps sp. RAO-2017]
MQDDARRSLLVAGREHRVFIRPRGAPARASPPPAADEPSARSFLRPSSASATGRWSGRRTDEPPPFGAMPLLAVVYRRAVRLPHRSAAPPAIAPPVPAPDPPSARLAPSRLRAFFFSTSCQLRLDAGAAQGSPTVCRQGELSHLRRSISVLRVVSLSPPRRTTGRFSKGRMGKPSAIFVLTLFLSDPLSRPPIRFSSCLPGRGLHVPASPSWTCLPCPYHYSTSSNVRSEPQPGVGSRPPRGLAALCGSRCGRRRTRCSASVPPTAMAPSRSLHVSAVRDGDWANARRPSSLPSVYPSLHLGSPRALPHLARHLPAPPQAHRHSPNQPGASVMRLELKASRLACQRATNGAAAGPLPRLPGP